MRGSVAAATATITATMTAAATAETGKWSGELVEVRRTVVRTRAPTSPRSIGFCAIWDCITSSSSSRAPHGRAGGHRGPRAHAVHACHGAYQSACRGVRRRCRGRGGQRRGGLGACRCSVMQHGRGVGRCSVMQHGRGVAGVARSTISPPRAVFGFAKVATCSGH